MTARTSTVLKQNFLMWDPQEWMIDLVDTVHNPQSDVEYDGAMLLNDTLTLSAMSSTTQVGYPLTATNNSLLDSFADDNNTTLANAVYTNIRGRTMLFKDATGISLFSVRGQIKCADEVDFASGVYAGVQGYFETMDDTDIQSGAKVWGVDASLESPASGAVTVDSGGILGGLHAELTGAGSFTQSSGGILAGLYIDEQVTTGTWGYGIYIAGTSVDQGIQIGELSSTAQTGKPLTSSNNTVIDSFADDNNTTLVNAVYTNVRARTMLFKDATGISLFSVRGQIKSADGVDFGPGVYAGVQGYQELNGDTSIQSGAKWYAVDASIDVPTGKTLTVDSGGVAVGLHAELTGLGTAASSGLLIGVKVDEAIAVGDWDYGVYVASGLHSWYSTNALAGAASLNNMELVTVDETTAATGYGRTIYASHTNTGTKTGSAEVNVISADFDASGNVTTAYCFTGYTGALTGATINRVAGYAMYIDAIAGTVAASSCAHLETNGGATVNDFISVRRHAGTIGAIISDRSGGATATHLLHFNGANAPIGAGDKSGGGKNHAISVQIGATTKWIQLYD